MIFVSVDVYRRIPGLIPHFGSHFILTPMGVNAWTKCGIIYLCVTWAFSESSENIDKIHINVFIGVFENTNS